MRARLVVALAAALAASLPFAAVQAQTAWPDKTVKIVVPYPAGPGTSDRMARVLGEKLSKQLGQPFIVDNRPGASGNLGSDFVAKAVADGSTLLLSAIGPIAINPSLFKKLPFDVTKDLQPVAFVAEEPFALVTSKASGATTVKELIAKAKARPDRFSFGSSGVGSGTHVAGELFQRAAGVEILHVPYKGGTATINDVVSGLVTMTFTSLPLAASFHEAGKLNVLAVTGARRSALLPDVPTVAEAGVPGAQFASWYGVFAPARTPKPIVERINAQFQAALRDPEVTKNAEDIGLRLRPMTVAEFSDFVKAETARMQEVVRSANITLD